MIVDCAVYTKGERRPGTVALSEAFEAGRRDADSFVWIGLHQPTEAEFESVAEEFLLHPLAVEDAIHAHQRPKLEIYDETMFIVVKTARYDDAAEAVEFAEIQMFAGEGFLVTVRHGQASALKPVRSELEHDREKLALGPIAAVHAIIDRVVDDYLPVLDGLDNDLVEVECEVFSSERSNPATRIYKLKRQVLEMYRNIEPLLGPLERLKAGRYPLAQPDMRHYFRDVEDHLEKVVARVEIQRDLLSDALGVNLTHVSVQQNEDMRKISGWVAIAAVPTMMAGIWGMNFVHMPELDEWWGYPTALALIGLLSMAVYRYLRRQGWI